MDATGNETETNVTRSTCDGVQLELELASCERTAEVMKVNCAFIQRFNHLVGIYEKSIVVSV